MNKDGSESIRIQPTTKAKLMQLAKYGDSMDDVILRLLGQDKKTKKEVEAVH